MLKILALACFFAAAALLWQRTAPLRLSFTSPPSNQAISTTSSAPVVISLSELNLGLPVFPGEIKANRWPVTSKGVIYLSSSSSSNTIIYGHNWPNILGHLKDAQVGQEIIVRYQSDQVRNFKISHIKIVGPNATEILQPATEDQLTLYTCTGFLDSKRLVVVAKPV